MEGNSWSPKEGLREAEDNLSHLQVGVIVISFSAVPGHIIILLFLILI